VVLCLYDLEGMGAEVLMQALRTHPAVIVDGAIHETPITSSRARSWAGSGNPVPFGSKDLLT
jgi:hypothetical protein